MQLRQLARPAFGQPRDDALQVALQHRNIHQVLLACLRGRDGMAVVTQALLALLLHIQHVVLTHFGVLDITPSHPRLSRRANQIHKGIVGTFDGVATAQQRPGDEAEPQQRALYP
ncbi:hypothetical protein D3C71_1779650 [compost metagenome]